MVQSQIIVGYWFCNATSSPMSTELSVNGSTLSESGPGPLDSYKSEASQPISSSRYCMISSYSSTGWLGHMYVTMRSFGLGCAIGSPVSIVFHLSCLKWLVKKHLYCSDIIFYLLICVFNQFVKQLSHLILYCLPNCMRSRCGSKQWKVYHNHENWTKKMGNHYIQNLAFVHKV